MRFFYDTEFVERGPAFPLQLISIGIVAEDGREYFAANADFDPAVATPWLQEHVLPLLPPRGEACWKQPADIAREIVDFVGSEPPEWWADYGAYDHVVLCQLFGDMDGLPSDWPMFTRDLRQWWTALGRPDLPPQPPGKHDALADARWLLRRWRFLWKYQRESISRMVDATAAGLDRSVRHTIREELWRMLLPKPLVLQHAEEENGG